MYQKQIAHTTQQRKIVRKMSTLILSQILADSSSQKQNENHRSGNPEWPIEIWIPL